MVKVLEDLKAWWQRVRGKEEPELELQVAESVFNKSSPSDLRQAFKEAEDAADSTQLTLERTMRRLKGEAKSSVETTEAVGGDTEKFKSATSYIFTDLAKDPAPKKAENGSRE